MANKTYPTLQITNVSPHVIHVAFNRPDKLNALSSQLFADIGAFFTYINQDPDVRVIVLTANGKHFTVGLDLKEFGSKFGADEITDGGRQGIKFFEVIKMMQQQLITILDCKVPVLMGIHGLCLGGGIDISCFGDIRYCTEDRYVMDVFSIKEVDIGMAADIGTLQMFPVITSYSSFFKDIVYTGRNFGAQEAKKSGFVSQVFKRKDQMVQKMLEMAQEISRKSPVAVWAIKNVIRRQIKKELGDNLEYMAALNMSMLQNSDMKLAVMGVLSKQQVEFPKL